MNPTILVLAAGMSTRYGRSKQLEPLGPSGETLVDYAVFDALRAGFSRVVLVIREELEEAFRKEVLPRWPRELEVLFHRQRMDDLPVSGLGDEVGALIRVREKPWGTAHAVLTARPLLPGAFVVLNADDFYGPSAYARAMAFLREEAPGRVAGNGRPVFALVAYTLRETLSRHGGVNRGLCRVSEDGWLQEVREVLDLHPEEGEVRGRTLGGGAVSLTGEEPISTNFWVFTPEVFPLLEEGFRAFLARELEEGGPGLAGGGSEFLIPTEVNRLLQEGAVRVQVPRATDPFFGITHPQDREGVVRGLGRLARDGCYPDPLWEESCN